VSQPSIDRFLVDELAPSAASTGEPLGDERPETGGEVALCLSGGGYRAALFHLGAVRRLDELGVLSRVGAISSVSGGSILAAFLAVAGGRWGEGVGSVFSDFEAQVAAPFRRFTRRNIRTPAILRRLMPWRWHRGDAGAEGLEAAYHRHLTGGRRLDELPEHPRFVFCATDVVFGVAWIFERQRVGDYLAGYSRELPSRWPMARAVAASSCFPPVFDPLQMGLEADDLAGGRALAQAGDAEEAQRVRELVRRIGLSDGGVYDNLGLEPVWASSRVILVSDGGAAFPWISPRNPFRRLLRYVSVAVNQVQALRYRWLASRRAAGLLDWAVWRISHVRAGSVGYPESLVHRSIATIRTDLDAFSRGEAAILENHGYLLADLNLRRYVPGLAGAQELRVPHPEWMDPARAAQALRSSSRRSLAGRTPFTRQ
jgi:NTE family protein